MGLCGKKNSTATKQDHRLHRKFHGTTITKFLSPVAIYVDDFVPLPRLIRRTLCDAEAVARAHHPDTAAVLVTYSGRRRVIVPPAGYFEKSADICKQKCLADG